MNLKEIIKNNQFLSKLFWRYHYKSLFKRPLKINIKGINNKMTKLNSSILIGCYIDIKGSNNKIFIGEHARLRNVIIRIRGNNNNILISEKVVFNRTGMLWVEDDYCTISIGANTTFEDVHLAATETNSKIFIGEDCMFAYDIDIRTGDSHSVYNIETKKRINFAKSIIIANHVWVASHVTVLKGVEIASNNIIATRSLVTKSYTSQYTIIGGNPSKVIKEGVNWTRERILNTSVH